MAIVRTTKSRASFVDGSALREGVETVLGPPDSTLGDENDYPCPFCAGASHLHVNYVKGRALCHGCSAGYKNLRMLLRDIGGAIGRSKLKKGQRLIEAVRNILDTAQPTAVELSEIALPVEYRKLFATSKDTYANAMLGYLKMRGVAPAQIEEYSIGYCEEGRYAGQLIIPVYVNDLRLFFTTRRVLREGSKTLNPKIGDSKRYVLMGYDRCAEACESGACDRVYLVEGPFDLFALERAGFYGVAVMGSSISEEQAALLSKLDADLVVCFDPDAHEKTKMWSRFLSQRTPNDVYRVLLRGSDDLGGMAEDGPAGLERIRRVLVERVRPVDGCDMVRAILRGEIVR